MKPEPTEDKKKDGNESDDDPNLLKPVLNGARLEKYYWSQTLGELTLSVYIPDHIKAKDLNITYTNTKLKIGIKGQPLIFDAEFCEKIKTEDTLWTIKTEEGKRIVELLVDKSDKMKWWDCPLKGEPKINTKKIDPENSKLSDLDGETRQTVEKMMFDQQQKMKGLPSSDELEKKDKLSAFMKAHPELDFSKAKFS